jgi:hypothetical protein
LRRNYKNGEFEDLFWPEEAIPQNGDIVPKEATGIIAEAG